MTKKKLLIGLGILVGIIIAVAAIRYFSVSQTQENHGHGESNHKGETDDHHGEGKSVKLHKEDLKEFGIEVEKAGPGRLAVQLELPGEIVPNADRLVHIVPRVPGVVRSVFKSLGDEVHTGETMAVLDSRELADAKATYLAALKRVELAQSVARREEELWKKRISAEQDHLQARQALEEAVIGLRSAEQKLHAIGFSEESLSRLPSQPDETYTRYEIKAPFSGTVIDKHITLGEVLKDDSVAFVVADVSSVWVNISIYQKDIQFVRKGQRVTISGTYSTPDTEGIISFVEPIAGEQTRTAIAHVVLPNPKGLLRPGLFVTAKLAVEEVAVALLIPKTALITEDNKTQVFIETEEGFRLRPITTGRGNETHVEVTSGLEPGQKYVAKGGFTLKAQLSKGAFGDGHAH